MKLKHLEVMAKEVERGSYLSLRRSLGKSSPRWFLYAVTNRCNMRCVTCDIWKQKPEKEMSPFDLLHALKDPLFENVEYVINSGGEPTMREDLTTLLLAEHEALPKAQLQLSTNGMKVNSSMMAIESLLDAGAKVDVGISLDGFGSKHDEIRGVRGCFSNVVVLLKKLSSLKYLRNPNFSLTMGTTLTDKILDQYGEAKLFAEYHGASFMFHRYEESDFYANQGRALDSNKEGMIEAINRDMPKTLYYEMWKKRLNGGEAKFRCFALHTFFVLHPNGDISPCLKHYKNTVGNVLEKSPSEIWNGEKIRYERKRIENCSECFNSWAVGWSINSSPWPKLRFEIRKKLGMVEGA